MVVTTEALSLLTTRALLIRFARLHAAATFPGNHTRDTLADLQREMDRIVEVVERRNVEGVENTRRST